MVALPFLRQSIHGLLRKRGYPKQISHIGDLIKARRLDLGELQCQVGERLGTDGFTISNWEKGYTSPAVRFYPKIIEYLDSNPLAEPRTNGEAIMRERMTRGWSRKYLAKVAGVDEGTVSRLERDLARLATRSRNAVRATLGLSRM